MISFEDNSKYRKMNIKKNLLSFILEDLSPSINAVVSTKINSVNLMNFISKCSSKPEEKFESNDQSNKINSHNNSFEYQDPSVNISENRGIGSLNVKSKNLKGKKIHLFAYQFANEQRNQNDNDYISASNKNNSFLHENKNNINHSNSQSKEKIIILIKKNLNLDKNYQSTQEPPKICKSKISKFFTACTLPLIKMKCLKDSKNMESEFNDSTAETDFGSEKSKNNKIILSNEKNTDITRSFDYLKQLANNLKGKSKFLKPNKKEQFIRNNKKNENLNINNINKNKKKNSPIEYKDEFIHFLDNFDIDALRNDLKIR